jgi:hydrogenase nickel incorporation protein HypA/HybF
VHELSIAVSLVELAEQSAREGGAVAIRSLRVRVGALSGVVVEALESAYPFASEGTMCEGAALEIEYVPARVRCRACEREAEMEGVGPFLCPACGEPGPEVVAGHELDLATMEIETVETGPVGGSTHDAAHP